MGAVSPVRDESRKAAKSLGSSDESVTDSLAPITLIFKRCVDEPETNKN